MTAKILTFVPALMLALGTVTAVAQPSTQPFAQFDHASLLDRSATPRPYDQGDATIASAAFASDGATPSYLRDQQRLTLEPGYSIGTGAARTGNAAASLSDGATPSYLRDQQQLTLEPGYSVGTGAAPAGNAR